MRRQVIAWVMALVMCLLISVPSFSSYADVNDLIMTDSNAAMMMALDDEYGISLLSDDIDSSEYLYASLFNVSTGKWYSTRTSVINSSGVASFPAPPSGYVYRQVFKAVSDLKTSGEYNLTLQFSESNVDFEPTKAFVLAKSTDGFASEQINYNVDFIETSYDSGKVWTVKTNLSLSYDTYNIQIGLQGFSCSSAFDVRVDSFNVKFGSDSSIDSALITAGSASTSTSNYIANTTTEIYESIQDLIQHISNQLAAFWDQLYNLIHLPTMDKMDEIITAIENVDLEIEVNLDGLKQSIDKMSADVQSKLQSTTDQITGGYDNSGMSSDKDRLDSSIQDYDEVENDLVSDATDNIDGFVFDLDLSEYIGPIQDISYMLQGIFETMGHMNVAVSFSLMLSVSLVLIGWYRFKGG